MLRFVIATCALVTMGRAASFDVASIRQTTWRSTGGEGGARSRIDYSPNSLTMRNVDVGDCVEWAWDAKFYQLSGTKLPGSERYDILAKSTEPVSVHELKVMLQDLLASRFKLVLHRESKPLPVYELIIARSGSKLPAPRVDAGPHHSAESLPQVRNGSFLFEDTTIGEFVEKLSMLRGIERPVVDRTGIDGVFDITLKSAANAILDKDGPSLFTLIQEQLGLKLQPTKIPMETFVIDHVEKPSGN